MVEFTLISFFIFLSVLVCVAACLISAFLVYRRNRSSKVHLFFALFFIGLAGFVLFYLFLQDPVLKEVSYPLQMLSMSITILGLSMFYYSLAHEGQINKKLLLMCIIILLSIPTSCFIFHPYYFTLESYGYELIIDSWFMILVNVLYVSFAFPTILGLVRLYFKTENKNIKQRLIQIFLNLLIMLLTGIIFFSVIPTVLNIHYLKPIGYFIISICVFLMVQAFKEQTTKNRREIHDK